MIRTDLRFPRHEKLAALVDAQTQALQLAHDGLHVERVYRWCIHLADHYQYDTDIAGACGLVHDLVHIPKDSPDRPLGSEQSALASQSLMRDAGYADEDCQAVVEAVRTCSWSRGLEATSDLGRILQDADRLDSIGAVGAARCFSCAQEIADKDSQFYMPSDPNFANERELDDRHHAVDHFHAKLLKLAEGMHFPIAQAEAERRHQAMLDFLQQFAADVRDPSQDQSCQ